MQLPCDPVLHMRVRWSGMMPGRARRGAAFMIVGLAVAGCSGGGSDKADAPAGTPSSASVAADSSTTTMAPGAGALGAPGIASASGGSAVAIGGAGGAGGSSPATGGQPAAGAPGGSATASGGGSGTPPAGTTATAEQCAVLRQALSLVDHPDLRSLQSQLGC